MSTTPAEQIALAADRLRDLAASGLKYAPTIYDRDRYAAVQQIAIELLALATGQPLAALDPLRDTVFARVTPIVAGAGRGARGAGRNRRTLRAGRAGGRIRLAPLGYQHRAADL